mmetsp:Transcript_7566/g.10924  ORF Transcript_7566/g.10924 Transcript_7566/m.10924 type:complete len:90 (+) Transcript_7566:1493-1762(+)
MGVVVEGSGTDDDVATITSDPLSITAATGEAAATGGAAMATGLIFREEAAEATALFTTTLLGPPMSNVSTTPAWPSSPSSICFNDVDSH